MENWRKRFIVLVGFFEAFLFSGCLFGWASLVHILQEEGVYSHLCQQQEIGLRSVNPTNETDHAQMMRLSDRVVSTSSELIYTEDAVFTFDQTQNPFTQNYELDMSPSGLLAEAMHSTRETVRCTAQDKQYTLVYTVAAVMYGLTSVLIGFSLDHFGLWVTRISASVMASTGFLCLAFASKDASWLLWPALNLMALGTNQLRLSCFQFANIYPKQRATIILLYSAAYSVSTVLFLVVQYAYEAGFSYKTAMLILCGISIMTFPVTFLMPRMKVEDEVEPQTPPATFLPDLDQNSNSDLEKESENLPTTNVITVNPSDTRREPNPIPLSTSLWTLSGFLHVYWQFINSFLVLFYSASFNAWARKTTTDLSEVAFYNKMMGLCQLIAPIFIPMAGYATDCLISRTSKYEDKVERLAATMEAPAYTLILTSVCAGMMLACKMFLTRPAIYISLVLIAMSRPLLVGSITSYLRIRFHAEHFNRLNGIHGSAVAIMCLVQYPVFVWMYSSDESFMAAHYLLMGLLLLSFVSPVHVLFRALSRKFARTQLMQKLEAEK